MKRPSYERERESLCVSIKKDWRNFWVVWKEDLECSASKGSIRMRKALFKEALFSPLGGGVFGSVDF